MSEKRALYFSLLDHGDHKLHCHDDWRCRPDRIPGFVWSDGLLDTGLLMNGKHAEVIDGKVFWTWAGKPPLWFAFFWWDRSGDHRSNSNSGFYVKGFALEDVDAAFAFACTSWPNVVARQSRPLVFQLKPKAIS